MRVLGEVNPAATARQLTRDAERSILRTRNGIKHVVGVGHPGLGTTPKHTVWRSAKAQLWRYENDAVRYLEPVVIVYSLITRSYMFDLLPDNSLVAHLIADGFDVFLLDWGIPDESDAANSLATYVDEHLPDAVATARELSAGADTSIIGYCLGGVLTALFVAAHRDAGTRNLVTMATPADFHELGAVTAVFEEGRLEASDVIGADGNVPPDMFHSGFQILKPTSRFAAYANLWQNLWNDKFVEGYQAMAQWSTDQIPFPGTAFAEIVDKLIRRNLLVTGRFPLGDRIVELGSIGCAHLNVLATQDHIVPEAAAAPLLAVLQARERDELRLEAGHVGCVAGGFAKKHTRPAISKWLADHSRHERRRQ
jgi:polyhydroxyalkanoate synthase